MNRREFIVGLAAGAVFTATGKARGGTDVAASSTGRGKRSKTTVALVKTRDRAQGIARAIGLLKVNPVKGKAVLLKPNFNTADPYPASTHNDTLEALFVQIKGMGAKSITLGERSGPPDTDEVMREKGIIDLCRKHDVKIINFEDLLEKDWVRVQPEGSHWRNGVLVARPVWMLNTWSPPVASRPTATAGSSPCRSSSRWALRTRRTCRNCTRRSGACER